MPIRVLSYLSTLSRPERLHRTRTVRRNLHAAVCDRRRYALRPAVTDAYTCTTQRSAASTRSTSFDTTKILSLLPAPTHGTYGICRRCPLKAEARLPMSRPFLHVVATRAGSVPIVISLRLPRSAALHLESHELGFQRLLLCFRLDLRCC